MLALGGEMAVTTFFLFCVFIVLPVSLLLVLFLIVRPRPIEILIKNRHVFITGGSSGIGLALAQQAASQGARVSILARSLDKLEEAKQSIKLTTGFDVAIYSADVRDFGAVKNAIEQAGPIDVLICSHGVFVAQELEKSSLEDFRFIIDINLMGTFHVIKAALPHMKNQAVKGPRSIAIVSSQAGLVGIYGYTAYSASKFGIRGMAESLQQEVIGYDIHVSLVFPSDTDTPGMAIESKRRPEITSIIAASSSAMKADEVAKISLDGIRSCRFLVPCNLGAFALCIVTAGMSPQRSVLKAFIEVTCAGLSRIAALCFQWNWYESIEKWLAQRNQ